MMVSCGRSTKEEKRDRERDGGREREREKEEYTKKDIEMSHQEEKHKSHARMRR